MYVGSFQAQSDVVWCPYNHDYGNGCDDDGDDDDDDDDEDDDEPSQILNPVVYLGFNSKMKI